MRVISKKIYIAFWQTHRDCEQALKAWHDEAIKANWQTPNEIKLQYKNASVVGENRVIFNICGNKYRLVVAIAYQFGAIYIKFIGTHKQYDGIDVLKIK
jgi:mRNA interferase HigB